MELARNTVRLECNWTWRSEHVRHEADALGDIKEHPLPSKASYSECQEVAECLVDLNKGFNCHVPKPFGGWTHGNPERTRAILKKAVDKDLLTQAQSDAAWNRSNPHNKVPTK